MLAVFLFLAFDGYGRGVRDITICVTQDQHGHTKSLADLAWGAGLRRRCYVESRGQEC